MAAAATVAALLLTVALAYGLYRLVVHVRAPVVPAVITRTMDAHRSLARDVGARIDRFLHDRPPKDRTSWPKLVALTFDDGPYPVTTPLLLDVLARLNVHATFFLIGRDAEEFPELTRRIARDGHEIANHTLTHANLDTLGPSGVRAELNGGRDALTRLARDPAIATMMRPPHGRFTEQTVVAAQAAGYDVILWNDDPGDWRSVTPEELAGHVEAHATAPDIILLHSGRLPTLAMLPPIVDRFRSAGFAFVTVGELLRRAPIVVIDHPEKHPL
ncbi:MAG: polysaccharide deacetylase family protein [Candidatus Eremiobacteraeota bacterium]|nr:polysaccharide deacetylase family protein [Candidatus Eremiobacteraeota bacterium]